jgi:hypothetical protein
VTGISTNKQGQNFVRVSSRNPCPVCGKSDWCMVAKDRSASICARIESPRRVGKDFAGFLHVFDSGRPINSRREIELKGSHPGDKVNWGGMASKFTTALSSTKLTELSASLGLQPNSLTRLGVGWDAVRAAFTFPMRDDRGSIMVTVTESPSLAGRLMLS